jgi:hypothetical protein
MIGKGVARYVRPDAVSLTPNSAPVRVLLGVLVSLES